MITPASDDSAARHRPLWWSFGLLAVLAPTLLAVHEPPSVTFYNQALAVLGWGLFVAVLAGLPKAGARGAAGRALQCLTAVLLIMAGEAFGSAFVWGALPAGLGMMGGGMSLAALLVLWAGWRSASSQDQDMVLEAFFGALTAAGCIGMVLALVQAFHPAWADGLFIAEPTMPGRAVGNLRQPNHFSTLLVFSCCGAAWLGARQRLPAWVASGLITLFIWGIVLTASRTGMIGMAFLTLWGVLDRRLPRMLRITLVGAPLIYLLFWAASPGIGCASAEAHPARTGSGQQLLPGVALQRWLALERPFLARFRLGLAHGQELVADRVAELLEALHHVAALVNLPMLGQ